MLRRPRWIPAALFLPLCVGWPATASALSIEVLSVSAGVDAESSASAAGSNDFETDADASDAAFPDLTAEAVAGVLGETEFLARGFSRSEVERQTPQIPTPVLMQGRGSALVAAIATVPEAFALASGEGSLRIVFRLDSDAPLRFGANGFATAEGAGDAFALVELSSLDRPADPPLASFSVEPGESEALDLPISLLAGERYELLFVVRAGADALSDEAAHYEARGAWFLSVPEPSTLFGVGAGLAALAARRR
jgi:hypothetical protein